MALDCQSHLFSLPADEHYLNCAYMGPLTKAAEAAGIAGVRRKATPRSITSRDFFTECDALRQSFGTLIHADADRVALVPAVSYGVAIAAHHLQLRRGQNVVLPGEEFPSNVYAWRDLCARNGAELRTVPRPTDAQSVGAAWNARLLEAVDANTAVVTLTAVHWTDGTRFDLEALGRRAREVGALYIVDGTQSIGALAFDWTRVQPDLLVCASYKWLLGPYQLGFAVLGERLLSATPFEHNWINRENSEDFAALVDYRDGFQFGARRFDVGEHSNPITVPMLLESLRQILAWGVDAIQGYCAGLGRALEQALGEQHGFALNPAAERGAHLFGVRVPHPELIPAILAQLAARKVFVSQRGTSVRVSPHVYNTAQDMEALADALKAAIR
jgi:selenocysteine lyase/cysteine desulfurase